MKTKREWIRFLVGLAVMGTVTLEAAASGGSIFTWQGDDGTALTDWGTTENWDLGSVPGLVDTIECPGGASTFTIDLNGNRSIRNVFFSSSRPYTINGAGDTLTMRSREINFWFTYLCVKAPNLLLLAAENTSHGRTNAANCCVLVDAMKSRNAHKGHRNPAVLNREETSCHPHPIDHSTFPASPESP